jgi:hydroxymethylbilane synthase
MPRHIKVGTRASKLARIQTEILIAHLSKQCPDATFEVVLVTTSGDKVRDRPIAEVGEVGVFVKELEDALLNCEVDVVTHSLKDLPTAVPAGLTLGAVMDREDPRDVLISRNGIKFVDLPLNSTVATSSRRRTAQLIAARKDLLFIDIRGNVPTRLRKHDEGECDAMILAAAGLKRLGLLNRASEYLDTDLCVPAAGQGALAAECRTGDTEILELLKRTDDPTVRAEVTAERAFLESLGGGCSVPIGALAKCAHGVLELTGCVAALDGSKMIKEHASGPLTDPKELGGRLAEIVIDLGAEKILAQLRRSKAKAISPP